MYLKQSGHYLDATNQMGSNKGRMEILERGKIKWEITKTLIRICSDKPLWAYYLDKVGDCVYYTLLHSDKYIVIGEVEYINEEVIIE